MQRAVASGVILMMGTISTMPPPAADARELVQRLVEGAARAGASDIHLEPVVDGYDVKLRIDGLLGQATRLDAATGRSAVARLMVLAGLLTYRQDLPQEGRFSVALPDKGRTIELRLAVMPTTHGLRAAVRLPAELSQPRTLAELGLPSPTLAMLHDFAAADAGLLLLCGPAGTGKTTTIYALLEHLTRTQPGLSLISIEDPVERDVPGVTQIEVTSVGTLTYDKALRSVLRQDPQVLALGEIRDRETALIAAQAAMSGHRVITTLHAGTPGGAVVRLLEMGLEPYQLTSSLFGVATMRLLRRVAADGYRGRAPIAEAARLDADLRKSILAGEDSTRLDERMRSRPEHLTLHAAAARLVDAGVTDDAEVRRVLPPLAA